MDQTAVVILNYNGIHFLKEFLPFFIKNTNSLAKIIVADNASTDNSVDFIKGNYPQIEIIKLSSNYGFAGGYNQALKNIVAKYFVIINSDVEVAPFWLEPLIETLKSNVNIAACQPKVLSYYDRTSFEYAGAAGGFIDYFGYPFCRGRILDSLEIDNGQYNNTTQIFWATGACIAIKADLFKKAGGFDESFFAHMEEIDLCWRLQLLGYEIYSNSNSIIYHVGGGTLPKANAHKTFLNFRNGLAMIYKNMPQKHFKRKIFARLILDGMAGVSYLLKGNINDFFAVIKAHFAFYSQLAALHKKRKIIQNELVNKNTLTTILNRSIVIEYFLKGKKKFSEIEW